MHKQYRVRIILRPIVRPGQRANSATVEHLAEDVLLADQTHVTGDLTEFRLIESAAHRVEHALHFRLRENLQIDEDFPEPPTLVHAASSAEL